MLWSAQRLVSRPARNGRANNRGGRALTRRTLLQVDCLEDRFTPAALALLGQPAEVVVSSVSIVNITAPAPTVITSVNAPVSSASTISTYASSDQIPFGFFHPFCQTGVIAEEIVSNESPVTPPPAIQPPQDQLPEPMEETPALPAAPRELPPALTAPRNEVLPLPVPSPAAPVDLKPLLLDLTRLNEVTPAAIDDRVWEELFKPAATAAESVASTDDAPESSNLGVALAAIGLLSLPPLHNRRERDLDA